ncbi:unnamed protein product, partial [Brugia pahangi]|uniref:Uncharacterized protein n=1 Tax=Brugia pahangi TaxID=6280 RepID=A0A0N4T0G2_BRUPA
MHPHSSKQPTDQWPSTNQTSLPTV